MVVFALEDIVITAPLVDGGDVGCTGLDLVLVTDINVDLERRRFSLVLPGGDRRTCDVAEVVELDFDIDRERSMLAVMTTGEGDCINVGLGVDVLLNVVVC